MKLQDIENNVIGYLSYVPERTPELVRKTLQTFVQMSAELLGPVSAEQIESSARNIESRLSIRMDDSSMIKVDFEEWLPARRGEAELYFYDRYRKYLANRGFSSAVLGVLDKDTDKVVGLMENPLKTGSWTRRGLVVGHVQSGKTANYTGVICKAADYGYKFIVVLTGIQEDLRVQTQERIEEGFIGTSTEAQLPNESKVGVGLYGLEHRPFSLTSRSADFKTANVNLNVALQALNEPLVLIMKKNSRILANLIEWIKLRSQEASGRVRGVPMLLIDDEADNASVNVATSGKNPSAINGRIRELLDLFERNVYLGYTATPFANIFIDPETTDEWQREDLFPRDFIISLEAPTNYVGASRIFSDDGDLSGCLVSVDDHEKLLPEKHKIDLVLQTLPESLKDAVRTFVLGRAVRVLRGQGTNHSSMLVNASRFNDVQTKITGLVSDLLNSIRNACKGHAGLSESAALRDPHIAALHQVWMSQYEGKVPEAWRDVQRALVRAVGPIEVRKINSKSPDKLDYRRYRNDGLHVIGVGGFALSRGFTLEGLMVSYFLRNSMMYDTLLQMGRWFGYRDGYADLCRIFMTDEAIDWYSHISEAIDELRDEFKRMERMNLRPIDFGLKVRTHPEALTITARNKMRTGKPVLYSVALEERLIETAKLRSDKTEENRGALENLVQKLQSKVPAVLDERYGYVWTDIAASPEIREFITAFANHDQANQKTASQPVCDYIQAREDKEMARWDVCLFSLKSGTESDWKVGGLAVSPQQRTAHFHEAQAYYAVSGNSMRVGSRGQVQVGMTAEQVEAARAEFKRNNPDKKNVSDSAYCKHRNRPLLMLHVLDLNAPATGDPPESDSLEKNVVAWGIAFPTTQLKGRLVTYVVNTVWWAENFSDDLEEQMEEEASNE